ncbi:MAG TPA: carboxypeptidase regulatory-like domain-containing protein [Bryobacteraceae bacterium]|nr:carboxypeptidase regulatory-like domain-containing protein [Bryobacteraceae bacterium]
MSTARIRNCVGFLAMILACLSALPPCLRADVTGVIFGNVRDSTGAAVANVRVTVSEINTNLAQSVLSDAAGEYRFLSLPVGTYRVVAELPGFQKFAADRVGLTVDQQRRVDITLEVGNLTQAVDVVASAVQVETSSTQLGQVIDDKQMLNLPLNGRSFLDLLTIQAGVAPQQSSTGNVSVNGQRGSSNSFMVNGGDVDEGVNFGTSVIPNLDSVAEFRLITNSFDAEYGRFSGAVMNAITKSGTNGFHGTAFEFLRNSDMDSRSFFNASVAVLKRNQFGYAVGGPAIKNKLFWFTDYQGTRQSQGSSSSITILPTVAQRSGAFDPNDLSGTVTGPYWAQVLSKRLGYTVTNNEPYSLPNCTNTAQCVFPNGVIPAAAMSPISVNLLKNYVPLPNLGTNQFLTPSQVSRVRDDKAGQRVDFVNKKTGNWSVYYHFDDTANFNPSGFGAAYGNFNSLTNTRVQQAVATNTRVFGPTAVNEARLDFTRNAGLSGEPTDPEVTLSSLGFVTGVGTLGIINSGPSNWQSVPPISLNDFSFGRSNQAQGKYENTYRVSDTFSKTWKQHAFKFGGSFLYMQVNERNIYAPNGNFSFDGSETGSDIADFLLGAPASYIQASFQVLDSRTRYGAAFAQDSWRIKPNLTLNLGVRWEVSMPWYDTQNKIETIVPGQQSTVFPGAPPGWVFPGDKGIPSTLAPTTWDNFAPRVGIAWAPNASGFLRKVLGGPGKTSIRAAFGIYYTAIQDAGLFEEVADAPYGLFWVNISPPLFDQPFLTRADGSSQEQRFPFVLPVPGSPAIQNINWSQFFPIASSPGYKTTNKLPYAEHYNFSIQRELTAKTLLTLAYVGTEGHKLFSHYEANPGNAALCLSLRGSGVAKGTTQCGPNLEDSTFTLPDGTQIVGTRSPLGSLYYSEDSFLATVANSVYNSLQVTVERRAGDFTFLGAYTFSKSLDDASSYGAYLDFYNFKLGRALSTFDATHNFVASYLYSIPFDRLFQGAPRRLTQGWSINGITRLSTGLPISLSESGDRSLTGGSGVDRPNYVGGLVITSDVRNTPNHTYFNKAAFTQEALGGQGTAAPRFFHGPGLENFDLGLQKVTKVRESMSVQFRAEFFNAFNHANFSNPSGSFTSGSFGRVTSAGAGRIGQMSLKFLW